MDFTIVCHGEIVVANVVLYVGVDFSEKLDPPSWNKGLESVLALPLFLTRSSTSLALPWGRFKLAGLWGYLAVGF
jgi:hypothetical protein